MAYIFGFSANCDSGEASNLLMLSFDVTPFETPSGLKIENLASVGRTTEGWEYHIVPHIMISGKSQWLNGHGGPSNDQEVEDLDSVANIYYERLKLIECEYNFAVIGVEVDDWTNPEVLTHDLSPGGAFREEEDTNEERTVRGLLEEHESRRQGLVISRRMYDESKNPPHFVPFNNSHFWIPWNTIAQD